MPHAVLFSHCFVPRGGVTISQAMGAYERNQIEMRNLILLNKMSGKYYPQGICQQHTNRI